MRIYNERIFVSLEFCHIRKLGSLGNQVLTFTNTAATYLNRNIYLVVQSSNVIKVYLADKPFTIQNDIVVKEMIGPMDIVACSTYKCCYVADTFGIWRVKIYTPTEQKEQLQQNIIRWLKNQTLLSLSIASNGNLLATQAESLNMYNCNGEPVYEIPLTKDNIKGVIHATETSTGTLIVCQTDRKDAKRQLISEITRDGQFLRSYGGTREDVYGPRYAVQDFDRDRLFVSDYFNHRVLLFDGKLRLQRVLVEDDDDWFQNLCYSKESSLLLISSAYGVVEVYRVSP